MSTTIGPKVSEYNILFNRPSAEDIRGDALPGYIASNLPAGVKVVSVSKANAQDSFDYGALVLATPAQAAEARARGILVEKNRTNFALGEG